MPGLWFTSDLHFGHEKVAQIRGFDNTVDHDVTVAHNWERVVQPQDTVYVLGDLTCDRRKREYALSLVNALPGTKHLIAGNHDDVSSIHKDGWKFQREYLEVFASVRDFAKIRMRKQSVLLSHYPYYGDHTETSRYDEFRLRNEGFPLLHGHTHSKERGGRGQVHVGLDAWNLTPVHGSVVENLLFGDGEETR